MIPEAGLLIRHRSLIAFLVLVTLLSTGFILYLRFLGQKGMVFAQFYMLIPAIAAIITRSFFYENRFSDANLRLGALKQYAAFWGIALGITALSYVIFTLLGSISWELSGEPFLKRLADQLADTGQNMEESLPQGLTPRMMLWLFALGGLTVFNVFPGIITGFGEEFGWRGCMFPQLYRIKPWVAFIIGGLIWYGWHVPLGFLMPQTSTFTITQSIANHVTLAVGSICTFTFLAYVYIKSRNIFVASLTHITLNNSAGSFGYFVTVHNQFLANAGLAITMMIVVLILYYRGGLMVFKEYFAQDAARTISPGGNDETQPAIEHHVM